MTDKPANTATIEFGKAFSFMFDDKEWLKKILKGGLFVFLSIFVIGIFFLLGYAKKLFLAHVRKDGTVLPPWEAGRDFTEGLGMFAVIFVYILPQIVLGWIPVVGCCMLPFTLLISFLLPAALAHYMTTNQFAAAFDFGKIIAFIQKNLSNYVLYFVIYILASLLSVFGLILLVVGVLFTIFWAMLVSYHALAQVWRIHEGNLPLSARTEIPAGS